MIEEHQRKEAQCSKQKDSRNIKLKILSCDLKGNLIKRCVLQTNEVNKK